MKANQRHPHVVVNAPKCADQQVDVAGYFKDKAAVERNMEKMFSLAELFQGIFSRLHPLFSIDCGALIMYDTDMQHITRVYISELVNGQPSCLETVSDPVSFSVITREIAGFDFPVLKSKQDWVEDFGENHCLPNHTTDYQFHCYLPLEINGRVLGSFELHNHLRELNTECLAFCSNIADVFAGLLSHYDTTVAATKSIFEHSVPPQPVHQVDLSALTAQIEAQEKEILSYTQQMAEFLVADVELPQANNKHYAGIIGESKEMHEVYRLLDRIAALETTVLILGETGTGKELIAKAVHEGSSRNKKTMVKVNCAAIPANLIESELFGHERGSFTGATERRIGKFEQAHNSTIFLDEIGELPLDLQVRLLRVLQEKEIERVGGKTTIPVDVRIISATNRELLEEVEAGNFRRDLFYRLNVFPISLPSLRERKMDIPVLAMHFLHHFARKSKRDVQALSKKAMSSLMSYHWPGNVRELEHVMERQVVMSAGRIIKDVAIQSAGQTVVSSGCTTVKTIFENERDHIFAVLELCNGKISGANGAAKLLGVPATTLNSKIKRLGLAKKHIF
jgi:transcriptional regulator with GAF, ATPase, and Fis domain